MNYLDKDDLIVNAYERFIDESSADQTYILDDTEARAIAYVKTVLGSRYNVDLIFDETEPIRNELLVQIISRIVVYNIIRRNAARKVPIDYVEDYNEAMKLLKDVATGVIILDGAPTPTDDNGNAINSTTMFGNNKNEDFYI